MSALSPHVLDEIKGLPARYPQPRSAVMPALDLAQEELGYLTPEAMSEVAAALELDPGYVEGVATFYSLFHLKPIGKHRFYVCTNLSCGLLGANEIVEHVKQAIGVKEPDEVSADGLYSYEEVECLGACEFAPMMRFDHQYHYDLTPAKIDALIAEKEQLLPIHGEVAPKAPEGPKPKKQLLPIHGEVAPNVTEGPKPKKQLLSIHGEVAPKAPEGPKPRKQLLPIHGEVVPKAPEGPKPKKPHAPRKKKPDA